ncbi:MAG: tetratricopeptide repeat protein [Candidatus Thorarchaeota archaeon]
MTDFNTDTPEQIEQLIKKGYSIQVMEKIQSVISSKAITRETKIIYQLVKCNALYYINYFDALKLLEEIEKEIFEIGKEEHQIDYYIYKARNLDGIGKAKEGLEFLEQAEKILQKSSNLNTQIIMQKRIDLLLERLILTTWKKRYFDFYLPKNFEEILDSFDECITLSREIDYDYGEALSLEFKGWFLYYENRFKEALEYYEEAYEIWKREENKFRIATILIRKGMLHVFSGNHNLSIDLIEEALSINKELEIKIVSAFAHFILNLAYSHKGDTKLTLKHGKIASDLYRDIGDKLLTALALVNYAGGVISSEMDYEKGVSLFYEALSSAKETESNRTIHAIETGLSYAFIYKGELNRALRFINEQVEYFDERGDYEGLAIALSQKGHINLKKGNLDEALKNYTNALEHYKIKERLGGIRASLIKIGRIFQMKGDYENTLHYFYESKKISEELKNNLSLAFDYWILISCYLDMEDMEKATSYLQLLQKIDKEIDHKSLKIYTKLSTALVLKKSENEQDRVKAKELLKSIIDEKNVEYEIIETTILNLCNLLLIELKISEDKDIIKQLKLFINKLQDVGIRELTYPLLVQTYWLQSQISLLELDVEKAQKLFMKTQIIAEEKDLELMARKISAEHDFLIGQLDLWEKFTSKLPSIVEILELTKIEDMLKQMLKRAVVLPSEVETEDEKPVIIFIFTESGEILFSEKLLDTLEDEIIEKILPEMKIQIEKEIDYNTARRGRLYDYSYILRKLDTLFFCYFFIGKSYSAIHRLEEFSRILLDSSSIWEKLVTSNQTGLSLNFEERMIITDFLDNIF